MNIFNIILIEPLANGLILFYRILGGNMGLAIVGFTIFLRLLLNPLTKPYMDSMKKMKDFAPDLAKLKKKYGGDKMKFAQAQSDFYKEKKINPGAGCLPYLLQIVVLIAFFNVFTRTISGGGDLVGKFNPLLYAPLKFTTEQVINTKFLYLDITKPDVFKIPSLPFPIPGPILILAALVQLLSSKLMAPVISKEEKAAKKTKGGGDDMQVAMQQSMTYTFPLFTIIFGMSFPSGLAIYWFLFSLMQMMQQLEIKDIKSFKASLIKLNLVKSKS
jgi:YidC/Oxa1 family membrane protein insertase